MSHKGIIQLFQKITHIYTLKWALFM